MVKNINQYNIIVPHLDHSGQTNAAIDFGHSAKEYGYKVFIYYLRSSSSRNDVFVFDKVSKLTLVDIYKLQGIVHTHGLRPDIIGALISFKKNIALISTLHQICPRQMYYDYSRWVSNIAWVIWYLCLTRYSAVVCISETMLRYYRRYYSGLLYEVVYNFKYDKFVVDDSDNLSEYYSRWIEKNRTDTEYIISYVGGINKRKNILSLCDYVIRNKSISLVICGQGPLESSLIKKISKCNRILFMGHVSNPKSIIIRTDVLVLPSYSEGMPLVVLEAARLGIPSLMSNIGVHYELAQYGLGEVFNHHNFTDFYEKLKSIYLNKMHKKDIVNIWEKYFSHKVGFMCYNKIFNKIIK